jgi:predicted ATPase
LIHQRTEGNPLFMVNITEEWLARGEVESAELGASTPATIQQMIERQFDHLPPAEQQVLTVASVAGMEFAAAAVAAGTETTVERIEAHCAALVRRGHFLQASGVSEWPDGTVAARYGFLHALYQEVLYERVTAGQRQRLHQRIGEREEQAYGARAGERAAELAVHFERGRDYRRAVQYHGQAAQNALRRSAPQEASAHAAAGVALLHLLADTPERKQQELSLQMALGLALTFTKGYAVPEVEHAYTRAYELCQQLEETPQLFPVLMGLITFYAVRAKLQTARELAEQSLRLAQQAQDPALLLEAHRARAQVVFPLGELTLARTHLEQGLALYDPRQHHAHAFLYGHDPGVFCLIHLAAVLWTLGYPDQASQRDQEALTLAKELGHPFTLTAVF